MNIISFYIQNYLNQGERILINIANLKEFYFKIKGLFYESRGEIYYIGGNDILPPPLEGEEELSLIHI